MRIYNILSYLESKFPISSQASFDNCGLLVGDNQEEVSGVIVCLDCTEEVLEEAMEMKCNLIIAHHPLIFKGLKKITGENYVERIILKAIRSGIVIYAIHTNLDHSIEGVNAEIGKRLGLSKLKILDPSSDGLVKLSVFVPFSHVELVKEAVFIAGGGKIDKYESCSFATEGKGTFRPLAGSSPFSGEIGVVSEENEIKLEFLVVSHHLKKVINQMLLAHPYEVVAYDVVKLQNKNQTEGSGMIGELENPIAINDFLCQLKETFQCGVIRHSELVKNEVKTIAFCGGSGSFLLSKAIQNQADIFITGDYRYHDFFDADRQIVIADIGHYESEQFTSDLIYRVLTEKFVNFAIHVTKVNTNPINYF